MSKKLNKDHDVFKAFLVENAEYAGKLELPIIKSSPFIPKELITFSKAVSYRGNNFDKWIIFYEYDENFERLWHNPKAYLKKLKKFNGVVSPDFSLYRDMPLIMQMWNTYRNRALASWLQNNEIKIIPNVRWGDERSFEFCFDGIEKNSVISVGTHGCIKDKMDRTYFKEGLSKAVEVLIPKIIIVYGAAPKDIFEKYERQGIQIINFESEFAKSRKQVTA